MGKISASGVVVLAVLGLGGCAHYAPTPDVKDAEAPFRIGSEDVLDVAVWRDVDLSRTLPVRPDGFISLPLVGEIRAEGKTPTQLADLIKQRLVPFIQEPKVTVIVKEVNSTKVFVTGEVNHPGSYPLKGRVSVLQAIALAGGFSTFANSDGIRVIREGDKGGQIPVRYSDLISARDPKEQKEKDFVLHPGDTVVVP